MSRQTDDIIRYVLFVGPDRKAHGGIAAVVGAYEDALGHITYAATTSCHGKAVGALRFAATMALLPIYRLRGFRIVHAHGSVRGSWTRKCLLLRWAEFLGMRTIHHIHNGALRKFFAKYGEDKARRQLAKADTVVALTNGWAAYMRDELGLSNVTVIENPVRPLPIRRTGHDDGTLRLLYLGAVARTKGIFELLDALADHKEELMGRVHLDIGGCGIDDNRMYEFIDRYGLAPLVTTHGWVTGEAKLRLLGNNNILVLPSYSEGLPIALLEAMAAGMPVIVTPVGGIPEMITDGLNGIFVAPKDKESIFRAIMHFIDNRGDIALMGQRNYEAVQNNFPDRTKLKLLELYQHVLSSCSRKK